MAFFIAGALACHSHVPAGLRTTPALLQADTGLNLAVRTCWRASVRKLDIKGSNQTMKSCH